MRTFDPESIVSLPRLTAAEAGALGQELLATAEARARKKKLPAGIERARKRLGTTHKELLLALQQRLGMSEADSARSRSADQTEDTAFSAFFDWLNGFAKLPETYRQSAKASEIKKRLFTDGLRFLNLPYKQEWTEAEARLRELNERGWDQDIEDMGGGPILHHLRAAHKAYGEALGLTVPREEASPVLLRETKLAFDSALRSYALQITAHGDAQDLPAAEAEEAVALAEELLRPLAVWETRTSRAEPAPPPPLDPAAPAAGPNPPA